MNYSGPHEMPKGLTLLSIAQSDGAETLGIKTGSSVIDVRAASRLLGIPAPLTMEELLREGNAAALTKIAANSDSAKVKPALTCIKPRSHRSHYDSKRTLSDHHP